MTRRKFHIRCDLEGVSGVVCLDQVTPGSREYVETRAWFMAELLALIDGLLAGGVEEISIYDEHWFGRNIDLARLPRQVTAICGKPPYRADWRGGLDETHQGMILHGLHSMAGAGHTLSHTYEPDFSGIAINGIPVGEIGVETAIAGDCGVPLVLIVADSAGNHEAAQLVPGVATISTKISRGPTGAECFSLNTNLESIHAAAQRIGRETPAIAPWRIPGPVWMEFTFNSGSYLSALRQRLGDRFVNPECLRMDGASVTEIWAEYWQLKLAVQRGLAPSP